MHIVNFTPTTSMYAEQVKISFKDSNGKSPSFTGAIMDNSAGAKILILLQLQS